MVLVKHCLAYFWLLGSVASKPERILWCVPKRKDWYVLYKQVVQLYSAKGTKLVVMYRSHLVPFCTEPMSSDGEKNSDSES